MSLRVDLAIIGGGNMAQAIVRGGLRAGVLERDGVMVAEIDAARREAMAHEGVGVSGSAAEALRWLRQREEGAGPGGGQVLLAVKPQSLAAVAAEIGSEFGATSGACRRVVISILAGTPSQRVRSQLGPPAAIVRAMPNLAAGIGQGATAVCLGAGTGPGDDVVALELFRGVGPLVVSLPEELMDAFTAVAGSGPAYLFYLAEAMMRGAGQLGFAKPMADAVVRQTLRGAAELLSRTGKSPTELRAAVTSKGGTTEAAVEVLDLKSVTDAIVAALEAATTRGRQLGR
jgi:pyrroline-5-carboxylate reductase